MMKVKALNDPQSELLLLRCCTGAPKFMYWVHCCSATIISDVIGHFDAGVDNALRHITEKVLCPADRDFLN